VRINAQLIDATTSGHVWAERYDGSLADVFALQDRVTGRIVDALAVSLTAREQRARERAETAVPEAYDAFLKGWEHAQTRTPEQYVKALEYFQRAVELDPDYARAHAAIASVYWKSWWEGWYARHSESTPQGEGCRRRPSRTGNGRTVGARVSGRRPDAIVGRACG